ncbi:MAG: S8 family serine peptidase [Pseudomonadota bacterium]
MNCLRRARGHTAVTIIAALLLPLASPAAESDDQAAAWDQSIDVQLPPPTRTITLKPRTDAAEFTDRHGLDGARITPLGRSAGSLIEVPMDEEAWALAEQQLCGGGDVMSCGTAACQRIQFAASANPGGELTAEAIEARIVRNPPERVATADPSEAGGSCQGSPLVPPLEESAAAGTGQTPNLDLGLLDSGASRSGNAQGTTEARDAGTPDSSGATGSASISNSDSAVAANAADGTRASSTDAAASAEAELAGAEATSPAAPASKQSFAFDVSQAFNAVGGLDLGSDALPADTSDYTLVIGAGCSEVEIPLSAIEPARLPGIVLALVDATNVTPVANTYGLTVVRQIGLATTGENLVVYLTTQNVFTVIAAMALDARVTGAQPERVFETTAEFGTQTLQPVSSYSDPFAAMNYAPASTGALALHPEAAGSGQLIAVIDTGVDVAHPDLAGRVREPVDTSTFGYGPETHGTAVAGIIAAEADNAIGSYGVAPAAEILPIKACHPKSEGGLRARCTTSSLVQALDVAMTEGASIINMSLAGPPDDLLTRYVNLALDQDRLVVAGAGNGGAHAKPGFPAAIPGVLAVTAVDVANSLYANANRGSYIDIAAPGVDIVSTVPSGQYPPLSGTSMAAAHVSGIAALLRELGPLMSATEVGLVLKSNTRDLGETGTDENYGRGLVDACKAAAAATADAVSCSTGGTHASTL